MHEGEIRGQLETLSSREIHDDLWAYLRDRGFVEDAQLADDLELLVDEVRRIWRAGARPKRAESLFVNTSSEPSHDQERAWALSRLVARHAQEDDQVSAFRARHLPDGLVPWSSLEGWLQGQLANQGSFTRDVTAPLPFGTEIVHENGRNRLVPPLDELHGYGLTARLLPYALPGDTWIQNVAVAAGSVLDQLRELSQSLASSFAWQPAQASVFVVCGVTPFIAPVRTSVSTVKTRNSYDVPWARRIKLDIDSAATPEQVVRAFRAARAELDMPQQRSMSAKHLSLAVFAGIDHEDLSWQERHRLWNERFPGWAYTQQSNFRRDTMRAQSRILGVVV